MNKGLNTKRYIFGILKDEKRAIIIEKFRKVTNSNGEFVSITHDNEENTNIIVANIKVVYTDNHGNFLPIPTANIAFEVSENFDNINQDNTFELAKRFLSSQETNTNKKLHYLGKIY